MQPNTKPARAPLNGVDTPNLLATINAVAGSPDLAKFQFRAHNEWMEGTHSKSVMLGFHGAGQELSHAKPFYADSDHPGVLCGADNAPTPVEWLLHALASCLMAGVANIAAARGIKLTKVKCSVDGDIDLRGILGISDEVRNGFQNIQVSFEIAGDAPAEKLNQLIEQSRARSAVFDVLTKGVPVTVGIKTVQ